MNQKGFNQIPLLVIVAVVLVGAVVYGYFFYDKGEEETKNKNAAIASFEECAAAGYPVMESYPRQCAANGNTFIEDISNTNQLIGGDTDEHGCLIAAGYSWCESKAKCLRVFEEDCPEGTDTNTSINVNTSTDETACSEGWSTYTNEQYGYTVKYPATATVTELEQNAFSLSAEEQAAGLTFAEKFATYGSELCVTFKIDNTAYVTIAAPENEEAGVICHRSGVGVFLEDIERSDDLSIDGTNYTGTGDIYISEDPATGAAGTTLSFHNETNHVTLEDGTRIEYGSTPAEDVLYTDYEPLRDTLICIMESYTSTE